MDRFQLLKKQDVIKPIAYKFRHSNNPDRVCDYMKKCIQDEVTFDASGIYPAVIDQAMVRLNKTTKIPIITKTEKMMRQLMLAFNLRQVYTVNSIPEGIIRAICYYDLDPKEFPKKIEIALVILRRIDEQNQ